MEHRILGLHHITAIAGNAQRNLDFYTKVLGLRLVKKTVNFDAPGTYHFYYGDRVGSPGTILTFFPWDHVKQGRNGTGMATEIGYAIPEGSLEYWAERLKHYGHEYQVLETEFGEESLLIKDPDGLVLRLVAARKEDGRSGWANGGLEPTKLIKGFYNVVLTLKQARATGRVLTEIFGYTLVAQKGDRHRYMTDAVEAANIVDLVEDPTAEHGINAGGTNHHVAFRVKDEEVLMAFRKRVLAAGLHITEKIDRNYFYSLYFREPGGVLFEIATDNPGFLIDEPEETLGQELKLPAQYEPMRRKIEQVLPVLKR